MKKGNLSLPEIGNIIFHKRHFFYENQDNNYPHTTSGIVKYVGVSDKGHEFRYISDYNRDKSHLFYFNKNNSSDVFFVEEKELKNFIWSPMYNKKNNEVVKSFDSLDIKSKIDELSNYFNGDVPTIDEILNSHFEITDSMLQELDDFSDKTINRIKRPLILN